MKSLVIALLALSYTSSFASSFPSPRGPETEMELINLEMKPGNFIQSIKEIKETNQRITYSELDIYSEGSDEKWYATKDYALIPEPTMDEDGFGGGIPTTRLCASITIDKDRFSRLRSARFVGATKLPAAKSQSKHGGRTGIGSDEVSIFAHFPDLRPNSPKGSVFSAWGRLDTSIVSNTKAKNLYENSSRAFYTSFRSNHVFVEDEEVRFEGNVKPVSRFSLEVSLKLNSEGWWNVAENSGSIVSQVYSQMADKLPNSESNEEKYWFQLTSSPFSTKQSHNFSMDSKARKVLEKPVEPKVSVCWKPNNYESVTMEPAVLVRPALILEYKKEDK